MTLTDYWYLWPWAALLAVLAMYWLVRVALEWAELRQRRRMRGYSQRYGSVEYYGQHRPNMRR